VTAAAGGEQRVPLEKRASQRASRRQIWGDTTGDSPRSSWIMGKRSTFWSARRRYRGGGRG
jgi:hypothetical protein